MYPISLFALFAFALYQRASGVPQVTATAGGLGPALPDLNAPATTAATSGSACDFCVIVADVAALVWYSQVFINTVATEVIGVQTGNNSRITRTSFIRDETPFTFDPNRMSSAGMDSVNLIPVDYASTVNVGGVILSSPTAYNIFSSYTISSAYPLNGRCATTSYARPVQPVYSEILPQANGHVSLDSEGQQSFISHLGFSTCLGGGVNVVPNALVPVANVTTRSTTTYSGVPLAAKTTLSLAPTSNPSSSARPAGVVTLTEIMSSTTVTATFTGTAIPENSASVPDIIIGSQTTITPTPRPVTLLALTGSLSGSLLGSGFIGNTTIIGSTQYIGTAGPVGTGVGGGSSGNYTAGVPYTGEAGQWRRGGWSGLLMMSLASILFAVMIL